MSSSIPLSGAPDTSGDGDPTVGGSGASERSGASPHDARANAARHRGSNPNLRKAPSHTLLADAAIEGLPSRSQVFRVATIESWRSLGPNAPQINEIARALGVTRPAFLHS
ncbi:MAG TPA: hypothetical protein PK857_05485 [Hyphomicrobium sp.]|nr:hypothetical protein [Hyphomicrobium sp.]HRO49659.1 hypothetical protein [Hyphomicrobium sp.]